MVKVVPLSSSLPAVELIKLVGMVVPWVVVPMICNPEAALVIPLDVLIMDGEDDEDPDVDK